MESSSTNLDSLGTPFEKTVASAHPCGKEETDVEPKIESDRGVDEHPPVVQQDRRMSLRSSGRGARPRQPFGPVADPCVRISSRSPRGRSRSQSRMYLCEV